MKRKQANENKPTSNKNISSSTKLPSINSKKSHTGPSHNLNLSLSSYQDEGLITLIQQYLLKNTLFDTLDIFQRDCLKGFKQSIKSIDGLKKQLLEAFDTGHRDVFEIKFTRFVPLSMRTKDTETLKIEFYIELYFYIYSIHPFLGKKKSIDAVSKQNFVSYLQGRGAILSKQEQFLPFYALAYLQKPHEHQTFKSMFTKQWVQDLRKQLILYIQRLYPASKTPTIVSIYDKFIELNLDTDKFSSVAFTEPDEEYKQNRIEELIEENLDDSIINNPQPVLLENYNGSNKILNNNSLEKIEKNQKIAISNQQINLNASFNTSNAKPPLLTEKEREELMQLRQRSSQFEEEKTGYLSYIETLTKKYQSSQNDRKQFSDSVKIILQQSQNQWFRLIQEIYGVALDVFKAALSLNSGIALSDPQLLVKKGQQLQRYKSFVSMNIEDLLSDNVADYSLFERPQNDVSFDMVKKNTEYLQKDHKLIQIDFDRIKTVLSSISDNTMSESDAKELQLEKCLILQALRWRMTRIRGAFQKREVVMAYIVFDVLQIKGQQKKQNNIINILLNSQNQSILHQTTLLILAIGNDYYGREYLFDQKLMIRLIQIRRKPNISELIIGTILVIFQILSNKRACQVVMIQNGLMEEVVQILDRDRDQMPPFIMEYTAALLVNMLLNKKGLDRAQKFTEHILRTLINLMETEHSSVKSFVHASLYPLLARKVFRQKALEFGLEENIKYLLQNNPSLEVQHQLGYVYNRLMLEDDVEEVKDEDPEFDDINDEIIGEDAQLVNQDIQSSLSGELLFMKKYPLTGPEAMKQMAKVKEQAKDTFAKPIFYDRQFQRAQVQTPLLGKSRKSQILMDKGGLTNNNSVYSNKSSNRILISQKKSRLKINGQSNNLEKAQLVTVLQKESEDNLKEHHQSNEGRRNINNFTKQILENDSFEEPKRSMMHKNEKDIQTSKAENTFRKGDKAESPLKQSLLNEQEDQSIPINQTRMSDGNDFHVNQSITERLNRQNEEQANLRNRKLKPYQQGQEFVQAFQTRALLVRTPPQKPN